MLQRVMVIAGEASGDLHGSGVVRELKSRLPALDVFGVGGEKMKDEGMELIYHISRLSFMGLLEVVKHLPLIKEVERRLDGLLETRRPDVLVLIDYPGFNLRFAKRAKARGIKVLYYISPQVWAWHKSRVKKIKTLVDRMKVVFPFEVDFYRKEGINVEFVGHPLVESIGSMVTRAEFIRTHGLDGNGKILALLPGSRKQEIEMIFPAMVEAGMRLQRGRNINVVVGVAPNLDVSSLKAMVSPDAHFTFVRNATYDLMKNADAAIVTSGTATLETGWFGTPMAVVYKTSPVTYFIGRMLVDVKNIGLVNIVAGEEVVPEFIQHRLTPAKLVEAVSRMLDDTTYAADIRRRLAVIKTRLGSPGAARRVVDGIVELAGATA
ncbi:MAG: lipid-A-disaccharide synthase [Bacteroidota bacterium]